MSLQTRLIQLVHDAEAACPHAVKVNPPLQGGLEINLRKLSAEELNGGPAQYVLTLWRQRVHPSIREWNTVTAHLPYLCPIIAPAKLRNGERYYLQALIPAKPPEPRGMEYVSDWIFASKAARRPGEAARAGGQRKPGLGEESV